MNPMMLMAASSAVSAVSSILGGIGAKKSADLNAFNIETERKLSEAEAVQNNNDRMDLYRSNLSANIASFAAQGRDIGADRSVSAFLDKQREIAVSDTGRSDFMAMMKGMQLTGQAAAARRGGRSALISGFVEGLTNGAKGYSQYMDVKAPTGGTAQAPKTSPRPRYRSS